MNMVRNSLGHKGLLAPMAVSMPRCPARMPGLHAVRGARFGWKECPNSAHAIGAIESGRPGKSQAGMTLVDVIMAVAILGIMMGGVLGAFRYGFFSLGMVRENQRATQIIMEKMETIRLYSWDQINSNGFVPPTFTDYYDPNAVSGSRGATYNGTATIGDCPIGTSYATNMRRLTVTLNWNTRDIPRTRSLTTYIAKDGIQNYVY